MRYSIPLSALTYKNLGTTIAHIPDFESGENFFLFPI
jgi:hypothetical protein